MSSQQQKNNQQILDSILAFFQKNPDKTDTKKHFLFLINTIKNLIDNPQNEEFRQFIFYSTQYTAKHLILEFLENNGFMQCEIDSELYIMYTDPSIDNLKGIPLYIKKNYLEKLMDAEDKAAEIASIYENRINSKMNPVPKKSEVPNKNDNLTNIASLKSIHSEYYQSKKAVEDDLIAYRNQMREKHSGNNNQTKESQNIIEKPAETMKQENIIVENKQSKKENLFQFQSRRENEQRVNDAQNQLQAYREEMKKKMQNDKNNPTEGKNATTKENIINEKEIEDYNKILEETLASNVPKKKEASMAELEKLRILEDQIKFGIKALEYTNEFRKGNGLHPISWNQALCDIGMPHSKAMAEGKTPLGHEGFDKRTSAIPFHYSGACENVAFSTGYGDTLCKDIVNGWINSPGHKKNLLSETNTCGIAVYRSDDGKWYFTQIFAKCIPLTNSFNRFIKSLKFF